VGDDNDIARLIPVNSRNSVAAHSLSRADAKSHHLTTSPCLSLFLFRFAEMIPSTVRDLTTSAARNQSPLLGQSPHSTVCCEA
jgi:hypothetical protein